MSDHKDTNVQVVTDATTPTLTLATVKNYLRVTHTSDDTLIPVLVVAAIQYVENACHMSIFNRALKMVLSEFPACDTIDLMRAPVNGSVVITYTDTNGSPQTFSSSNYEVSGNKFFPFVRLKNTASWPNTYPSAESVRIAYSVGFTAESDIPSSLVLPILLLTSHFYDNRSPVISTGAKPQALLYAVEALLDQYRRPLIQ